MSLAAYVRFWIEFLERCGKARPMRSTWRLWRTVLIAVVVTLAIGALLVLSADEIAGTRKDLETDLSRAGVNLAVTAVAGILATAAFKMLDHARTKNQERLRIFKEVVAAYNELKAARRGLRALGFPSMEVHELRGEEVKELRALMVSISETQLKFEALTREVEQSDLFEPKDGVAKVLADVEQYMHDGVVKPWEGLGPQVWEGAQTTVFDRGVFEGFTAKWEDSKEFAAISTRLDSLTAVLHDRLFGGSPKSPSVVQTEDVIRTDNDGHNHR